MNPLAFVREYQNRLGFWNALRWYALNGLGRRQLLLQATVIARARALEYPVRLRTPPSSDFDVFYQVLVADEYAFLPRLRDVRTAIDLGANIGLASAMILSCFPEVTVLAVEPDPSNCALLKRNVARYDGRCEVLQGAVWSRDGEVCLTRAFGDHREWAAAVKEGTGVRAYTVAQLLSYFGQSEIDLLKIDIEGSEVELFSGDVSWLRRVRNLCIELHGERCEEAFRNGMRDYRWVESRSGEYVVCEDIKHR